MKPETPFVIAGFLLFGAFLIFITRWQVRRGREMLAVWCADAGVDLLYAHHRFLFRGPFWWSASKGQMVYRISTRDRAGRVRGGYARCGGFWLGVLSEGVDVRWDA